MALETYTIEVKVDVEDSGHAAVLEVIKGQARLLMAAAIMVSKPDRTPKVMVRTEDRFYSQEDIDITEGLL
jgi:hypothetical protein